MSLRVRKILLVVFFVTCCICGGVQSVFAASYLRPWDAIALSNSCPGVLSNYTLTATNRASNNAIMNPGALVTVTFPAGTNANPCITGNGSRFNGVLIGAITNVSATVLTFLVPVGATV